MFLVKIVWFLPGIVPSLFRIPKSKFEAMRQLIAERLVMTSIDVTCYGPATFCGRRNRWHPGPTPPKKKIGHEPTCSDFTCEAMCSIRCCNSCAAHDEILMGQGGSPWFGGSPHGYNSRETITPWKFNIAPENIPSQKESSLPTFIFQGLC